MKKSILGVLILIPLIFVSCSTTVYEGSERYVIEGKVIQNGQPFMNQDISIYLIQENKYDFPQDYLGMPISEINNRYEEKFLSNVKTDNQGHFLMSVPGLPRSNRKNAYCIRVNNIDFGYITEKHFNDYYLNFNPLIIE